jgi:hypothetical protein
MGKCKDPVVLERLQRKLLLRESLGEESTYCAPHIIWKLGDIIMVSVPNEVYSSLQIALREALPDQAVFVSTLTNEMRGYLPPRHLYSEDHYVVWQTPFSAGTLELVTRELVNALKAIG